VLLYKDKQCLQTMVGLRQFGGKGTSPELVRVSAGARAVGGEGDMLRLRLLHKQVLFSLPRLRIWWLCWRSICFLSANPPLCGPQLPQCCLLSCIACDTQVAISLNRHGAVCGDVEQQEQQVRSLISRLLVQQEEAQQGKDEGSDFD
jgi:hypothetical protein